MKKGKILKKIGLGVLVFVLIVIFLVSGFLFVFGDKVFENVGYEKFFGESSYFGGERVDSMEGGILNMNGGVVGSESGDGGGTESSVEDFGCRTQQVQYSLKNFKKNVTCLESGESGCLKVNVSCSVEVYNFDEGIDDIFGIIYYLADFEGMRLDSEVVRNDVGREVSDVFGVEFVFADEDGVDEGMDCPFEVEIVPRKCV